LSADLLHIEGMGVLGSLLARHLTILGRPFTWSDTDDPHAAWPASTGLVYPDGDPAALADLATWGEWADAGLLGNDELSEARYVYAQKTPPHGGRYATSPVGDTGLTLAHADCWQVDPQRLVSNVRIEHADARRDRSPDPAERPVVRAHATIWRHTWGWSAPVTLDTSRVGDFGAPVAFIGRRVTVNVYAYPVVSAPGWWRAGSALYDQTRPRPLDADAHLARWAADWARIFPAVPLGAAGRPVQGWRPRPHPQAPGRVTRDPDGALRVPALWHSGVRRAPCVITALLSALDRQEVR
jgi:hypothetical protein